MRRIIYIMVLLLAVVSCTEKELQEEFVNTDSGIGLTIKGEKIFDYTENNCQYGYNESKCEFRVCNDTMSDYFVIQLDKMPAEGSEASGNLVYTTATNVVSKSGVSFKLLKSEKGYLWFWNRKNSIGVVVRSL